VTPPLTSSPHVGCLLVVRAPVDTGEYARPLWLGLHVSLRPLGSGQPVGYLSFSLRRSAPRHRQPQPSLCLSRGPDHRKPGTKLPRKKENLFISHFFPHKREGNNIPGPPAPEPTTSPAASRRLRGAPYPRAGVGGGRRRSSGSSSRRIKGALGASEKKLLEAA